MYNYYDDIQNEAPDIICLSSTKPVAKKQHICFVCRQSINIGERYSKTVYKNYDENGEIQTCKMHMKHEHGDGE